MAQSGRQGCRNRRQNKLRALRPADPATILCCHLVPNAPMAAMLTEHVSISANIAPAGRFDYTSNDG